MGVEEGIAAEVVERVNEEIVDNNIAVIEIEAEGTTRASFDPFEPSKVGT